MSLFGGSPIVSVESSSLSELAEEASDRSSSSSNAALTPIANVDQAQQQSRGDRPSQEGSQLSGLESEDEVERPNRFKGPPSTWLSWVAPERSLAASLDQTRANDLSIHLYNAHALRARVRPARPRERLQCWDSKESWIAEESKGEWEPDPKWTAWPLEPDIVPGPHEEFIRRNYDNDDNGSHYGKLEGHVRPSQALQEVLVAQVLRAAKERWERRSWSSAGDATTSEKTVQHTNVYDSETGFTTEDQSNDMQERLTDAGIIHSATKPVVLADDDQALDILTPTVRHVLSRFDELLISLHHARRSYAGSNASTASATDVEGETSRLTSRADSDRPRKARRSRRKRERNAESEHPAIESDISEDRRGERQNTTRKPRSATPYASRSRSTRRRPSSARSSSNPLSRGRRIGLRDWSDVLGIASMHGWPTSAIERAAQRCANLFGETMPFQTLLEGNAAEKDSDPILYAPGQPPPVTREADTPEFETLPKVHWNTLLCPYANCKRHTNAFNARHRLTQHMKRSHGYEADDLLEEPSSDEMAGGVHVDRFLKPLPPIRQGRGKDVKPRKHRPQKPRSASFSTNAG